MLSTIDLFVIGLYAVVLLSVALYVSLGRPLQICLAKIIFWLESRCLGGR